MSDFDPLWLVLAGFGGGLAGSVAGLASLITYPALLAVGLSPISANVSNTVALVFSSAGSIWGSRPELVGQRERAERLGIGALCGGLVGSVLLLTLPAKSFSDVVPVLIGLSSLGIFIRRKESQPHPLARPSSKFALGVFSIAVYGGYFGAASGVLLLAALLYFTGESLARSNAMKNVLLGLANVVASILFIAFGPVRWSDVLPLAAGFIVGGRLGPLVVRRAPTGPLRILIAVAGILLAVHLALDAYG